MRVYKRGDKWYYDVFTEKGKRIRKAFAPGDLEKYEAFTLAESSTVLKLAEFVEEYLSEIKSQVAPLTISSYRKSLYIFIKFLGEDFKFHDLTARHVAKFASVRLQNGIKPETVNSDLRHIRAALNKAVKWEYLSKAPLVEMVKVSKRLPRHLTVDQMQTILDAETEPNFKRLWTFLLWTGCRRGEALGLKWEDVELGERPQALVTGKGDRQRVVPLLPPAVAALGPPESGAVFPSWSPFSVSQHFRRLVRRLGIQARVHDLRHTCLTWLVGKGVPLKLVQDIAGHASINTTMLYAKVYSGESYDTVVKAFGFE